MIYVFNNGHILLYTGNVQHNLLWAFLFATTLPPHKRSILRYFSVFCRILSNSLKFYNFLNCDVLQIESLKHVLKIQNPWYQNINANVTICIEFSISSVLKKCRKVAFLKLKIWKYLILCFIWCLWNTNPFCS